MNSRTFQLKSLENQCPLNIKYVGINYTVLNIVFIIFAQDVKFLWTMKQYGSVLVVDNV